MLIFLDESFRSHRRSGKRFGVLAGVAIPEDRFHIVQRDIYNVRQPYHGTVLRADQEIKGRELLGSATFKTLEKRKYSYQWNLATELLQYSLRQNLKVFGVVCFRPGLHSFVCGDENRLDSTFRDLFDRIDTYMKRTFPGRFAKLVFDNRDNRTNEANARAITNFFVRSSVGLGYDSIVRVPFFAASQGHNYGLQLADLITTVVALRFQGEDRIHPLEQGVQNVRHADGGRPQSFESSCDAARKPVNKTRFGGISAHDWSETAQYRISRIILSARLWSRSRKIEQRFASVMSVATGAERVFSMVRR